MEPRATLLIAVVVGVSMGSLACSGSEATATQSDAGATGCRGTVSGALSGEFQCGVRAYGLADGGAAVDFYPIRMNDGGTAQSASANTTYLEGSDPAVRTYTLDAIHRTQMEVDGIVTGLDGGFEFSVEKGTTSTPHGNLVITFTNVSPPVQTSTNRLYQVHGTMHAELTSGSSLVNGNAVIDMTF